MIQKIILARFPTHVAITDNKVAANKYMKVNNQSIYNSNINRFARNRAIINLHLYIESILKSYTPRSFFYPVKVSITIFTVRNHGSISRRKGIIHWKPVKKDYKPNWDIENLYAIWSKVINDSLTNAGFIVDDTIEFIDEISCKYKEVTDIDDRRIEIEIND